MLKRIIFSVVLLAVILLFPFYIRADELSDIANQIQEVQRLLNESKKASKPLEDTLAKIEKDFRVIENNIASLEEQIREKEEEIDIGEKELLFQKKAIETRIRSYYKQSRSYFSNVVGLLLRNGFSEGTRLYFYEQQGVGNDRAAILKTTFFITTLEERKAELLDQKKKLAVYKVELAKQKSFYDVEVGKARKYQGELEQQIAQLNQKQQSLIAQKLAGLNIPRSAGTSSGRCSSDLTNGRDPGFSPRIGFFTYGAPHRNGLNQYGAKRRAEEGQSAQQMLSDYYPNMSLKTDYDANAQVNVDGHGTFSIEDYTKRIYEVPIDWPMETLKAQAVAARTYALNSMQRNGHICTSEACQVFQAGEKGGRWNEAVDATRGWVLMDGGNPGFTQYASTHGGYVLNLGKFDGANGNPNSFAELNERAYDRDSPWFYCNWGSRPEYASTAWLKPEEVADIFNVISLARADSSTTNKLYQPDKPHPDGGEVWGFERVKQELRARGKTPLDSVTDVSIGVDFGSGKTTSVSAGGVSVSGSEFKDWFNLRAPANIQIVGPLYNVERR